MKYVLLIILISLFSCQQKIGYVDNAELLNKYEKKIELENRFKIKEETYKKKQDSTLKVLQLEYQKLAQKVKKMSAKKQQEESQLFNQKYQMIQQQLQIEQQTLQGQFQTEIDSLLSQVKSFVSVYGKKNGYDYILGTNKVSNNVLYGKKEDDLSKNIIDALNQKYKDNKN